jgi:hypothetical protein
MCNMFLEQRVNWSHQQGLLHKWRWLMVQIRKRPKQCQHRSCQSGECGKCVYNPRSGYPVLHLSHFADPPTLSSGCFITIMVIMSMAVIRWYTM